MDLFSGKKDVILFPLDESKLQACRRKITTRIRVTNPFKINKTAESSRQNLSPVILSGEHDHGFRATPRKKRFSNRLELKPKRSIDGF